MSDTLSDSELAKHIDMAALNTLKDVMEGDFPLLLETFLEDSALRLDEIRKAVTSVDAEDLVRCAHSLKGACGNMGFFLLAEMCKEAEQMGRDARMETAEQLLQGIESEYAVVRIALAAELEKYH